MDKLGIFVISAGINVNLLLLKDNSCNDIKFPISDGIDVNLLLFKSNSCNNRFPISVGIDVKLLLFKDNHCNDANDWQINYIHIKCLVKLVVYQTT